MMPSLKKGKEFESGGRVHGGRLGDNVRAERAQAHRSKEQRHRNHKTVLSVECWVFG